jgi:formylmethanofuran dehydrogenase subunit B
VPETVEVTCAGCGCACDELEAVVGDGGLESLTSPCPLGEAWFTAAAASAPPVARVDGTEVELDEGLDAAAEILGGARLPLIYGLGRATIEAGRTAVGITEIIGGVLDPAGPALDGSAGLAIQTVGVSTSTLGEIRDRSRTVVVWREDPVRTIPRLLPRLGLDRAGRAAWEGGGAGGRRLVVVDAERTATAEEADAFIELPAELDFEALWVLRALVEGKAVAREHAEALPFEALEDLAAELRGCVHGTVLHGFGLSGGAGGWVNALGLFLAVRDLTRSAHVVTLALRREVNAVGAEDVLAWQTGYPAAVSFARRFPRSSPGEFNGAAMLARGEVDAALVVASDPFGHMPDAAVEALRRLPSVVIDPVDTPTAQAARVALAPAAPGVFREGTVHRMDGIPVPLRAPLEATRPGEQDVLADLQERLRRRR